MNVDHFSRIDVRKLYPPFLASLRLLVKACADRGWIYIATSGTRTYPEQANLYAKGRTAPGRIVTNADAGYSLHNFGAACDFCHDADLAKPGLQPDYRSPSYDVLAEEAEKLGLESGVKWKTFKDPPHIQMPIRRHGVTLDRLRREYVVGGYDQLFRFFDGVSWFIHAP